MRSSLNQFPVHNNFSLSNAAPYYCNSSMFFNCLPQLRVHTVAATLGFYLCSSGLGKSPTGTDDLEYVRVKCNQTSTTSAVPPLQLEQVPGPGDSSCPPDIQHPEYHLVLPRPFHTTSSPLILESRFSITIATFLHILHPTYPPPHLNWMHRRGRDDSTCNVWHQARVYIHSASSMRSAARAIYHPKLQKKRTVRI